MFRMFAGFTREIKVFQVLEAPACSGSRSPTPIASNSPSTTPLTLLPPSSSEGPHDYKIVQGHLPISKSRAPLPCGLPCGVTVLGVGDLELSPELRHPCPFVPLLPGLGGWFVLSWNPASSPPFSTWKPGPGFWIPPFSPSQGPAPGPSSLLPFSSSFFPLPSSLLPFLSSLSVTDAFFTAIGVQVPFGLNASFGDCPSSLPLSGEMHHHSGALSPSMPSI